MSKVYKIINDVAERSQYDWKLVLLEDGTFGYTTSKKVEVGQEAEIEVRNKEFKYYVKVK